jgi:hypothetical protein
MATIASVRHYMGDVPICLLIDGAFPTDDMQRAFGVQTLYRAGVKDEFLRKESFNWGLTKMVALWESPFEKFLFLDADTLVLGDLTEKLKNGPMKMDWDFFIDKPRYQYDEKTVRQWFFDVKKMEQIFPEFRWRDYTARYFCTGVWAARRGVFPLKEYKEILKLYLSDRKLFFPGEMGFLNFMIFRAEAAGKLKVAAAEIQVLVPDFTADELNRRWQIDNPPANIPASEAVALHYTSLKPAMSEGRPARPMTYFRRVAAKASGLGKIGAFIKMRREDIFCDIRKIKNTKLMLFLYWKVYRRLRGRSTTR